VSRIGAYFRNLREKMVNEPLSPNRVAAGWALGMFAGCSIPFGFQLVISIPLSVWLKVSKVGATLGTLITNPVTILFIYPAQTYIVSRLFFGGSLTYERLKNVEWTFDSAVQLGAETLLSFLIGGLLLAFIMTPITFFAVKAMVTRSRARRHVSDKS
jgi:uncharacterized protein (DUF2062 family)